MDRNSLHLIDTIRATYQDLDMINELIKNQNTKISNELEFGMIYLE
jgi:hypothetical protein